MGAPRSLRRCAGSGCRRGAVAGARLCGDCLDGLVAHLHLLASGHVVGRAAVRGVLATWAHVVVTGRVVARPARSVAGLAEFLCRHIDWLGAHPAAAEFAAEVVGLVPVGRELAA